jgi:hypothetical protein
MAGTESVRYMDAMYGVVAPRVTNAVSNFLDYDTSGNYDAMNEAVTLAYNFLITTYPELEPQDFQIDILGADGYVAYSTADMSRNTFENFQNNTVLASGESQNIKPAVITAILSSNGVGSVKRLAATNTQQYVFIRTWRVGTIDYPMGVIRFWYTINRTY